VTELVEAPPLTADDLAADRFQVEKLIGRPLRLNEQAIDVLGIDAALNTAKEDLDRAIKAEQKRAIHRALGTRKHIQLELTGAILDPLERLFRLGRREAYAELQRQGYETARRAFIAQPKHPQLLDHVDAVNGGLHGLSIKLERARFNLESNQVGTPAIARALLKVPGGRAIAAAAISRAFTTGLQQTFEANQDLVDGWEYTSVLDSGTCDACAPLDGTEYATLDELFNVLPGFGPNPFCLGGDRCRCRAIPAAARGTVAPSQADAGALADERLARGVRLPS
jgi:hypothetical protein